MSNTHYTTVQQLNSYQLGELKKLLAYLEDKSPFYREHFKKHNLNVSNISGSGDLAEIPAVTKEDLQNNNWDFLCVDRRSVVEYCTTSGTLGSPVTIALTENDLERLAKNELESFKCAGVNSDDIILLTVSLDRMFMAVIAYYLGARALGAGIIRGGPGNFSMQLELIERMHPTVLVAVPSFVAGMAAYAEAHNIDLNKSSVKKIICIGENIRNDDF